MTLLLTNLFLEGYKLLGSVKVEAERFVVVATAVAAFVDHRTEAVSALYRRNNRKNERMRKRDEKEVAGGKTFGRFVDR